MSEKSLASCIAQIKKINARFRKFKKNDGPEWDRLAREKDLRIDEMAALCDHPAVYATRGARQWGPRKMSFPPRRICPHCGLCEARSIDGGSRLAGKPATWLPVDQYVRKEGEIVKRLGINL